MQIFSSSFSFIKTNISKNARWYFILAVLILFGIITGLILTFKGITDANIYEKNSSPSLFDIVTGNTKSISLFFSYILNIILSIIILLFFTLSIYSMPLSIIYLVYQGYILGVNFASLIILSGVSGAMSMVFFLLPINLISFAVLLVNETAFIARIRVKRELRLSMLDSYKEIAPSLVLGLVITIFGATIYAIIYPIVIRSIIIVTK